MPKVECEKLNCNLEAGHVERDGSWHVKKGARGKIIISWLDGEWKGTDGSHGTYRYQDPVVNVGLCDTTDGCDVPHPMNVVLG